MNKRGHSYPVLRDFPKGATIQLEEGEVKWQLLSRLLI